MITPWPHQVDGERKIREAFAAGFKAPLYVLSTGGGKTFLFSSIARSAEKRGKRVLILCHRVELVDQIVETLKEFEVIPDIIAAGYIRSRGRVRATNLTVAVASVQTLIRRLDHYPEPTLIIIDEAHHAVASTWTNILKRYNRAKILGVTATPMRADGRGLARHFDTMIIGPSVAELTRDGYLASARVFAPPTVDISGLHIRAGEYRQEESEALMDKPTITGSAVDHYRKHSNNLPALVFCTSVQHAHHVAEQFRSAGYAAIALDGGTDRTVRRGVVDDFRAGKITILTNCQLFTEGFDVKGVHVGIMLRPTASEGLWRQMVGRILRVASNKPNAIILDHVGGVHKWGLPDDEREWTLTEDFVKRKNEAAPSIRVCPKCFAASPARSIVCRECGHVFEVKPRQEVEEKEGELVELTPERIVKKRERMMQGRSRSLEQLEEYGKKMKYSPGWAAHVWRARQEKKQRA